MKMKMNVLFLVLVLCMGASVAEADANPNVALRLPAQNVLLTQRSVSQMARATEAGLLPKSAPGQQVLPFGTLQQPLTNADIFPVAVGSIIGAIGLTLLIGNIVSLVQGHATAQGLWGLFGALIGGLGTITGVLVAGSLSLVAGLLLSLGGGLVFVLGLTNLILGLSKKTKERHRRRHQRHTIDTPRLPQGLAVLHF